MAHVITLSNGFDADRDRLGSGNVITITGVNEYKYDIDNNCNITHYLTFYLDSDFNQALELTNWEVSKERSNTLTTFQEIGKGIAIPGGLRFFSLSLENKTII